MTLLSVSIPKDLHFFYVFPPVIFFLEIKDNIFLEIFTPESEYSRTPSQVSDNTDSDLSSGKRQALAVAFQLR